MSNPYFNSSNVPQTLNRGSSSSIRNEFLAVQSGFDTVATSTVPATSITSVSIGTGSKVFNTQSGKAFSAGQYVLVSSDANQLNNMFGQVDSYAGTVLTVTVATISGSGSFADWNIALSGPAGSDYTLAKDQSGGIPGLTGYAINIWNAAKTFMGKIVNPSTAGTWTWTLPDRDGTLADDTDLAGKANLSGAAFTGNITTTGAVTALGDVTAFSDERLKTNWRTPDDNFIRQLVSVKAGTYDRTDVELTQVGVSAQDVQAILPNAVHTDTDGTLSLNYGGAAMVAVVMLAREVVRLSAEIELMKRGG